jgi:hypothetical protein
VAFLSGFYCPQKNKVYIGDLKKSAQTADLTAETKDVTAPIHLKSKVSAAVARPIRSNGS